eukprot:TRINITY_DN15448_c0_g3_i1.p1 TRINITY_DN15448_c0_g3~~TRINITY_DN15448_c0_g3_i1.p1  ORF type:complete len:738 (+),score=88.98 TRINITY_DN15448_c0_g3_i1:60-2273(+)
MKFGKQLESLELPKYRGYYVQYKDLKKAIKVFTGQERTQATVEEVTHWTSSFLRLGPNPNVPPEARLQEILVRELERVSKFAELEEVSLRSQLDRLSEDVQKSEKGGESISDADLVIKLRDVGDEIVHLGRFAQLNFSAFRKILKKYDKWSKSATTPWFMPQVARAPMMTVKYDELILKISHIAALLRQRTQLEAGPSGEAGRCPPSVGTPQGATEVVFLVDSKDTIRVKVELALQAAFTLTPVAAPGSSSRERTRSSYFDSKDFSVYRAHAAKFAEHLTDLDKGTGVLPCASVHLRSCGDDIKCLALDSPEPSPTRSDVHLLDFDVTHVMKGKQSDAIKPANATPKLAGAVPADSGKVAQATVATAQRILRDRGLSAKAQSSFVRSVFGGDVHSGITVVVDEDVRVAKLSAWDGTAVDSTSFPYDVMSIAFSSKVAREFPNWMQRVFDCADVFQVTGFSKAAHAIGHFYAESNGLKRPHWYRRVMSDEDSAPVSETASASGPAPASKATTDPVASAQDSRPRVASDVDASIYSLGPASRLVHEFGGGPTPQSSEQPALAAGYRASQPSASGSLLTPLLESKHSEATLAESRQGFVSRSLQRLRGVFGGLNKTTTTSSKPTRGAIVAVQPKTLYSLERTFLEWVHFATVFAALGIGVLHTASTNGELWIGRFLTAVSIFVVLWSLHMFNWRADALDAKAARDYRDNFGPPAIVVGLLIALVGSSMNALAKIPLAGPQ